MDFLYSFSWILVFLNLDFLYPSTAGFLARAGCGSKQDQGDPGLPTQGSFFVAILKKKEPEFIGLDVIGLTLRAVLSKVPERTFIECFL